MRSDEQAVNLAGPARTAGGQFLKGHSGNPSGWAIQRIKVAERAAERDALAAELERDLGRKAGRRELMMIEAIVSAAIEARKLRKQGRSTLEQDRLVTRGLRSLGLEAAAQPARMPLREYLLQQPRDGQTKVRVP